MNSPSCSFFGETFVEFILSTTLGDRFFWSFCFQDALCSAGGSPASGFEGRPEEGQVHHRALPRRLLLTARQGTIKGTTGRPVDKVRCRWFPRGLVNHWLTDDCFDRSMNGKSRDSLEAQRGSTRIDYWRRVTRRVTSDPHWFRKRHHVAAWPC